MTFLVANSPPCQKFLDFDKWCAKYGSAEAHGGPKLKECT